MSLDGVYDPDNIFAKIVRGDAPAVKVFEDHDTLAFMDVFPQGRGHVLVVHKRADARNILDIEPAALTALALTTQRIVRAMRAALRPDGVYVAQFNGAEAGQSRLSSPFPRHPALGGRADEPSRQRPNGRHRRALGELAGGDRAGAFMSGALSLRLTRLSPTHHRFEYRRADGTGETVEMETRSFLIHDFIHYVVERRRACAGSFYGVLAKIGGYEELSVGGGAALGGEIAITERVVGALTGALQDEDLDPDAFVARVTEYLDLFDERAPRWLSPAFVLAVRERMRQLTGRWNATPFGETMELEFIA